MKFIKKYKSLNFDKRATNYQIKHVIIHYTAMKANDEALKYLCSKKNKVSAHFLISKFGDIYSLVDIKNRAWHAGISNWKGDTDINSSSIGIEMDNSGHHLDFENFTIAQIESLTKLLDFLIQKYEIKIENILGHSDIAPYRKIDPGEKFPWKALKELFPKNKNKKNKLNLDMYVDDYFIRKSINTNKEKSLHILSKIGYEIQPAKNNELNYLALLKAYQMHHRSRLVSGKLDLETYNLLINDFKEILTI